MAQPALHVLGRWQEVAEIVGQVRSGAVLGINGQAYETTIALQLVMQGRYDEAEQHLRRAEEIAPSIRDPQAIAPMIDSECAYSWHAGTTTWAMPSTVSSR